MMTYALAIVALTLTCGCWVAFQRWIARRMPGAPGIERRCDGCPREGCAGGCDEVDSP